MSLASVLADHRIGTGRCDYVAGIARRAGVEVRRRKHSRPRLWVREGDVAAVGERLAAFAARERQRSERASAELAWWRAREDRARAARRDRSVLRPATAARHLGLTESQVRLLVAAGVLSLDRNGYIARSQIEAFGSDPDNVVRQAERGELVDRSQLAKRLGLPRAAVHALHHDAIIQPAGERYFRYGAVPLFRIGEVLDAGPRIERYLEARSEAQRMRRRLAQRRRVTRPRGEGGERG